MIQQVLHFNELEHFIQVLEPYDKAGRSFYEKFKEPTLQSKEKLFIGYEKNIPVFIATLFYQDDAAGVFNLITREDKRGLGYGTKMMIYLLSVAKKSGVRYATLSASNHSGYRIYERLGFRTLGQFECFEWKKT